MGTWEQHLARLNMALNRNTSVSRDQENVSVLDNERSQSRETFLASMELLDFFQLNVDKPGGIPGFVLDGHDT